MEIEMLSSNTTPTPRAPSPTWLSMGSANPALSRSIPDDGIRDLWWFRADALTNPRNPNLDRERDQIRLPSTFVVSTRAFPGSDQYVPVRPEIGILGIRGRNSAPRLSFRLPDDLGLAGLESRRERQAGERPS